MARRAPGRCCRARTCSRRRASGLMWLNGDRDQGPVPFGLAIADLLAGGADRSGRARRARAARPDRRGRAYRDEPARGAGRFPVRGADDLSQRRRPHADALAFRNAHAYLAAPYGVYPTRDGWLAIAMTPLDKLAKALDLPAIAGLPPSAGFERRDEIKRVIADHVAAQPTAYWLARMQPADIWCAEVLDWPALLRERGFPRWTCCRPSSRPRGRGPHDPLAHPRRRPARALLVRRPAHRRAHRRAAGGNGALTMPSVANWRRRLVRRWRARRRR